MYQPEEIASIGEAVSKHAITSTDQRLVCTMAMVCKGWRVAVQGKAPAGLLDVDLKVGMPWYGWAPDDAGMPSKCMLKLASFSQWLPQHAKLARRLEITGAGCLEQSLEAKNQTWFKALAETIFSLALRSAAAACIETSAQQQLQPLGLQSYSSNVLDTSAVLQSLPVASLTELIIDGSDSRALAAALPRLTNLQRLEMYDHVSDKPMAAVFQAAQQLSTLTELGFPNQRFSSSDIKLVPPHLLRLQLRMSGSDAADFSHMTRVTSLGILRDGPSAGYRFPAQLVELSVADDYYCQQDDGPPVVSTSNISSLKCLKSLFIEGSRENAEDLLQLVALPKLQKLCLSYYTETQKALAASAAWAKLRQLQDIDLAFKCSSSACMQLFCKMGEVTWLTRLQADIQLDEHPEQQAVPIAICSEICKLPMLQDLHLEVYGQGNGLQPLSSWPQDDMAQLSNLTQLTKLHLCALFFGHEVINDAIVVQLLPKMKQLQELSVPVRSVAVLPVIAQSNKLKKLILYVPEAVQRSGLQYLQGMKSLTALRGFEKCGEQALADFWAAVRA